MKTAKGLVEYVIAQLGKPYWNGTFGQAASKALYDYKKTQYPKYYWWDYNGETGVKVHDCVGLVKGYLWSKTPDDNTPIRNPVQDVSDSGMYDACKVKGEIDTMPMKEGVLVFYPGHMGVYIGGGYVVEARGHNYGVVKTKLDERGWTNWGLCPFIDYNEKQGDYTLEMRNLKKGCKGEDVCALQILLIGNGFSCGKYGADGDFGAATDSAVREYQLKNRLVVDGIAGANTMKKLLGI